MLAPCKRDAPHGLRTVGIDCSNTDSILYL